MHNPEQDIKIVRGCVKGEPAAWNEFVERFSGLVMWSIKNRLSKYVCCFTNSDLEDILQEVFLSIYKENKLAGLKDPSKIAPWIVVLSGNTAIDKFARVKGRLSPEQTVSLFEEIEIKDNAPSAAEEIEQNERENIISETIGSLSPKEKIIINLRYTNGNTITEIAGLLNMRQGSVASVIARARKKIKKNMHKNRGSLRHI